MIPINLLLILLIAISLVIIMTKDNLKAVIYFSVFSLICASLYFFYHGPDLALAEAAIGSAIIPLIFIVAIGRQREYLVISHLNDRFLHPIKGPGYELLQDFTNYYNLKLVIQKSKSNDLHGIFRTKNVDLIVEWDKSTATYVLKGKKSNVLMHKLEQMTEPVDNISVLMITEDETDD